MRLPDAEALLIAALKADAEVTGIVGGRVYAQLPATKVWPALRLTRFGGAPAVAHPLVLDAASIQIDAFATSKGVAFDLVDSVRNAVAGMAGVYPRGIVTGAEVGSLRYVPDVDFDPPLPRFSLDVTLWVKPNNP